MEVQFCAEITDFKIVYHVLKAITFKEYAIVRPMEEGLKITVEEMRCVETSAYIPSKMFTSYYIDPNEIIKFKLSLKVLTECFYIYGDDGNPSLKMTYKGPGSPLYLVMKHSEENITVDCQIHTMDVEESAEIILSHECTLNNIVINAVPFVDILFDLDSTSDELELLLSPEPPFFRIITRSVMGESQTDISKHSEIVPVFQCDKEFTSKYAFSYIKQILKVMTYADKVSISTGESGLLGLQLIMNTVDNKQMYIEYYVTAVYDNE